MATIPHTSDTPHTPHTPPFTEALLYLEAYEHVYGFALTLMGAGEFPIAPTPHLPTPLTLPLLPILSPIPNPTAVLSVPVKINLVPTPKNWVAKLPQKEKEDPCLLMYGQPVMLCNK